MPETFFFPTFYYQDNPATLLLWLGLVVIMNIVLGSLGNCVVYAEYSGVNIG